jgi:hypothetical protein
VWAAQGTVALRIFSPTPVICGVRANEGTMGIACLLDVVTCSSFLAGVNTQTGSVNQQQSLLAQVHGLIV